MASISVYQARAELSQLIERALSGEEIVITRRRRPTVQLLPVEQAMPQRKPGALNGLVLRGVAEDILEAFYNSSVEPQEEAAPAPDAPERR